MPFGDSSLDRRIFHGRDEEIVLLTQRVLGAKLLVLFGASGVGKTSLLRAGLFKPLRDKEYLPVPLLLAPHSNVRDSVIVALRAACADPANAGVELTEGDPRDLWPFLQTTLVWKGELLLTPVLVFDQFEEVFIHHDETFRRELADELGALVSGVPMSAHKRESATSTDAKAPLAEPHAKHGGPAPRVKIVLSISEEYLGALEELSPLIPGLFQDRVRLSGLTDIAARQAICEPAALTDDDAQFASPRFTLHEAALHGLIDFLLDRTTQVEPFHLQLLCRHAEQTATTKAQRLPSSGKTIQPTPTASTPTAHPPAPTLELTLDDLGGNAAFAAVLHNFYRDTTAALPWRQRRRVRRLCEEGLLSTTGTRQLLEEGEILAQYGVTRAQLEQLVEGAHLLRRERRLESMFYEIGHERLAASIVRGRRFRVPRHVRHALWGAAAVAVITIGLLVYWNVQIQRARDAQAAARAQAEDLVGFLLGEDFLERLRLVGRSEMLDNVQARVEKHLPSAAEAQRLGSSSVRNRALAHRNQGQLLEARGFLMEAAQQYETARQVFAQLTQQEPQELDWQRELGRSAQLLGDVRRERGEVTLALQAYTQAEEARRAVQKRLAGQPGAVRTTVDLAETRSSQGLALRDRGEPREALGSFAEALKLVQGVQPTAADDVVWRLAEHEAQDGHAGALEDLGQSDVAVKGYESALRSAQALVDAAPYLPKANYRLAVAISRVAPRVERARSVSQYAQINDTLHKLVNWDPTNAAWRLDSSATAQLLAHARQEVDPKQGAAARAAFDDACKVVEQIEREHPAEGRWKAAVADCYGGRGSLLSAQRHWHNSHQEFLRAAQRYSTAAAADSAQIKWRVEAIRAQWLAASQLLESKDQDAKAALLSKVRDATAVMVTSHPDLIRLRSELAMWLTEEANIRRDLGDSANAEKLRAQQAALVSSAPADQQSDPFLLQSQGQVELQHGKEALARGDHKAALAALTAALARFDTARSRMPKDAAAHDNLSTAHARLADVHEKRTDAKAEEGQRRGALKAAVEALALAPDRFHPLNVVWLRHYELAGTLVRLNHSDEALRELNAGVKRLEQSIAIARDDVVLRTNASLHWKKVAQIELQRGDLAAEERARRAAVAAAQQAAKLAPDQWDRVNGMHVSLVELGDALRRAKHNDEALRVFEQALEPLQQALKLAPKQAVLHDNLRGLWARIATAQADAGNATKTETALRSALQAAQRAAQLKPDDGASAIELSRAQLQLAVALSSRDQTMALEVAQQGVKAAERAVALNRGQPDTALNLLGLLLGRVGLSKSGLKDVGGAVDAYRGAVAALATAEKLKQNEAVYVTNLYHLQDELAANLLRLNTAEAPREALTQIRAAIDAGERAAKLNASNTAIREDLRRLRDLERELAAR